MLAVGADLAIHFARGTLWRVVRSLRAPVADPAESAKQLSLATVSQFFPPEEELFQEIEAATPGEDEAPHPAVSRR